MRELTLLHRSLDGSTWRVTVADSAGDLVTLERSTPDPVGGPPRVAVLAVPSSVLALALAMAESLDP